MMRKPDKLIDKTTYLTLFLLTTLLAARPGRAEAIEIPRPTLVVYITENPRLTKRYPGLAERVAVPELRENGYRILSPMTVRNLPALCPLDVRGVWNADRMAEFRKYFNADVLWMASVEYTVVKAYGTYPVGGTVSVVATAFSADTGKPLWFDKVEGHELKGATPEEAAREALAEIIPAMVKRFDSEPRIRQWVPSERPRTWPPDVRMITPPPPTTGTATQESPRPEAMSSVEPPNGQYTGVIVDADHLRIMPSYRTRLYSERGHPIVLPEGIRMGWADRSELARLQAGPRPLRLRALRSDGRRIILRERDARTLGAQRELLNRGRVTVVVRPPR